MYFIIHQKTFHFNLHFPKYIAIHIKNPRGFFSLCGSFFYVDLTFDNLTRYRQSIDAITPLVKKIKVLGEYEEKE